MSSAIHSSHVVITAGLAEIAAGAIAMGLGGFLAAHGDAEHYASEREREAREIIDIPDAEKAEVVKVFQDYGLSDSEALTIATALSERPKAWVDFMMRFEHGLEEPEKGRAKKLEADLEGWCWWERERERVRRGTRKSEKGYEKASKREREGEREREERKRERERRKRASESESESEKERYRDERGGEEREETKNV